MPATLSSPTARPHPFAGLCGHVSHESFDDPDAATKYDPRPLLSASDVFPLGYMPDEVTRDCGRRMHYAAYRSRRAAKPTERRYWRNVYFALRDRIVLGNQKLVYKAVRYRKAWQLRSDDLVGEGHVVLINAVERFNPWLGVRFSTYAFTCLVRALVRLTRKRIVFEKRIQTQGSLSSESLPSPAVKADRESSFPLDLDHFFQAGHPLLSDREKTVLRLRFGLGDQAESMKLELIGERLGLSKERIRQVQVSALAKLREAVTITRLPVQAN
jgi:RNA polymerase sigma factor (sigma-70 family)